MRRLKELFDQNRRWADRIKRQSPRFFEELASQQNPDYFWIGCSDSRVPANEIIDLPPGEVFVHRNIANLVVHTDLNCLSAIQYAVDVLQVKHIIVCGHYGCGGIQAVLEDRELGLTDNWLRHVKDVLEKHQSLLDAIPSGPIRAERLVELNVVEQVRNVCQTTVVQAAWKRGQDVAVHGWLYRLSTGLIHDLDICVVGNSEVEDVYRSAVKACRNRGAALMDC